MINKLETIFINYSALILSTLTIITLLSAFILKKIKRRRAIKMKRTINIDLTEEEHQIILQKRAEEKAIIVAKEKRELDQIIKQITPEAITIMNTFNEWLKKLKERKEVNDHEYPDHIEELIKDKKELNENE